MTAMTYLPDAVRQLRKYRRLADRAARQVDDTQFFAAPAPHMNSIAIVMKHVAGNMRSRWTDFLTSDGEKPSRRRDTEFVIEPGDTRGSLTDRWNAAWDLTIAVIEGLAPADLDRTVTVRGEPHSVLEAVNRQLVHYAYHVGQIVLIARAFAGDRWEWLSIPPGKSQEYDVSKEGKRYTPS